MTDDCERCGASLAAGVGNYLELEVGAERGVGANVCRTLCDRCSAVVAFAVRANYAGVALALDVVDLADVYGERDRA